MSDECPTSHETNMPRFATRILSRSSRVAASLSALAFGSASLLSAQDTRVRIVTPPAIERIVIAQPEVGPVRVTTPERALGAQPRVLTVTSAHPADRAVLGVTMGASGKADTAGVRIAEVDTNGPAAKAGIKANDVIQEINGISLRVSAADADDSEMTGIGQRRLQRVMEKAKVGDEIDLRVRTNGTSRAVKVKTASAAELAGAVTRRVARIGSRDNGDSQGSIGLAISSSGNARDTLGLFVVSVSATGPAEKSGIIEGDRVAAVNGVDVRIPREDVEDASVSSSRVSRFVREVRKVAPGGSLTLRVYSAGRYREVTVPVVRSSELPGLMHFNVMTGGDGAVRIFRSGRGDAFSLDEALPEGMNSIKIDSLVTRLRSRLREIKPSEVHVVPRKATTLQKGTDTRH